MLVGKQRTSNQWLTELVSEIARTVRCLDKDLLWSLIEPLTNRKDVFPIT